MQDSTQKNIDLDELVNTLLREREGAPADAPAEEPQPEVQPEVQPVAEPQPEPQPPAAAREEVPAEEEAAPPPKREKRPAADKKKRSLFAGLRRHRTEETQEDEDWDEWGLKPIGHYRVEDTPDVESIVAPQEPTPDPVPDEPKPVGMDEFPPVQAVAETITMPVVLPSGMAAPRAEEATRVLPIPGKSTPQPAPQPEPEPLPDDQLPDQLSLEEMVRVEDIDPEAPAPETDADPEETLLRARQERVREFALSGEEEEINEPEEEAKEPEEEPEIEDFTGYQDTKAISLELQYRCRTALFGLLATGVLELVLLILTLLTAMIGDSPITAMGYLTVHLFALGLMMVVNYTTVSNGLSGLFSLQANKDTAPALAAVVALFAVILHFIDTSVTLPYWTPIAGLLLVLNSAGWYAHAVCVRRNFAFVSYPGRKYAAALIEDETALREIGRRAVGEGEASVAYFRPTAFLSDYLANAYDEDRGDMWSRWMAPVGFAVALVLSAVLALTGHVEGFWGWLQLFTGMVCLAMPATGLAVQLPLNQCCRHMLAQGGFLVGWSAVEQFGSPDALVVDVADLYPDESMLLHGIKTFSGAHIDDAILDAASLSVRSGGPLAMIFRRIIQNKEELLHEVDSLVYEQGMGLSGWVDGRRVLVGNRRLLQNHGVDVPSSDYEARYAKDGRCLVYLSTAGELSAMFVVSYLADPEIQAALQDLCRSRVTLLVRSCDPNITTDTLCEGFGLDEYYVDVLPAAAGRLYMQLAQGESEQAAAVMASNGHILGTARALSTCRSVQWKTLLALVVQALAAAIGVLLCLVWTLQGTISPFQPLLLVLGSVFLSWLLPLFRRI